MKAFQIPDVKDFMSKFLSQNIFDNFLLTELEIQNYGYITINGRRNRAWYDDAEWDELTEKAYLTWKEVRPAAFSLIRGHKRPMLIKGVLQLAENNTVNVVKRSGVAAPDQTEYGLYLNVRYEREELSLITGVSMSSFIMDKSLERQWDEDMSTFLKHYGIAAEQ